VPFVVTTRKIVTVALSIVYFGHQTSVGQVLAIIMVLMVTVYEFCESIKKGGDKVNEVITIKTVNHQSESR
jgi:small basic protein